MYVCNVHPQLLTAEQTNKTLHYYETSSHMFIGPYKENEGDSCFACFYHHVQSNESDFTYIIDYERTYTFGVDLYLHTFLQGDKTIFRNQILLIDKKTMQPVWKKVRKTPFCSLCSHDQTGNSNKYVEHLSNKGMFRVKSKQEIASLLDRFYDELIDRDVGVGMRMFRDAESNLIPMYAIESRVNNRLFFSYGRTNRLSDAKHAALLEMLERYSSMIPQFKQEIYGSYASLQEKHNIVPPSSYMIQGEKPFDKERTMFWSEAFMYPTNKIALIPEQMMYFDNQLLRKENRFIYETSNGTAMGGSLEEALVYAVLEAIERDCFLTHWYTKKQPKLIDVTSISDGRIKSLMEKLTSLGYEMFLLDITLETDIPAVWVLMRNRNEDANLYIYNAAGSHYDPEHAIYAALVEVGTSIIVYEEKLETEKEALTHLIHHPEAVVKMEDHVNYYAFKENAHSFSYLFDYLDQLERVRVDQMRPSFPFSFQTILDQVISHHPEMYYVNMNNPLIDEMELNVVKVFIPTLQPMTFGKQNERINMKRLQQIGQRDEIQLGKEPHPFP